MTRKAPTEECLNCGKLQPEPDMLYIVAEDGYVCGPEYWDKFRDKDR